MARVGCISHCGGCDRHFTGLTAFDAHRIGGECKEPESAKSLKSGRPLLQIASETGFCNKMPGCFHDGKHIKDVEPVVVWQSYSTEEEQARRREAFSR